MAVLPIIVKKTYAVEPLELTKAREELGLSQEELAEKMDMLGWTQRNISYIESRILPKQISVEAVTRLEQIFDVRFQEP